MRRNQLRKLIKECIDEVLIENASKLRNEGFDPTSQGPNIPKDNPYPAWNAHMRTLEETDTVEKNNHKKFSLQELSLDSDNYTTDIVCPKCKSKEGAYLEEEWGRKIWECDNSWCGHKWPASRQELYALGENKTIPAPKWLKDRMDASRKMPSPTLEEVETQLKASAKVTEKLNKSDKFDEFRKIYGAEKIDTFLSKFGLGPKYIPKKRQTHSCPKCKKNNAYYKEEHPDTDMNEIVLYCPDCEYSSEDN